MIIEAIEVEPTGTVVLMLFIFISIAILINCKYLVRKILIRKNIIGRTTELRVKKLNIIFSISAISLSLIISLLYWYTTSLTKAAICMLVLLITSQIIYAVLRSILEANKKVKF